MNENTPYTSKNITIFSLVAVLLLILAAQSWYMIDTTRKLDALRASQTAVTSPALAITDAQTKTQSKPPSVIPQQPSSALNDWDPDQEFQRMRAEIDQLMTQAFNQAGSSLNTQNLFASSDPATDIQVKDQGEQYLVLVDLPGADRDNVSITLNDKQLTVSGQQNLVDNKTDTAGNTVFHSQHTSMFSQTITLPGEVKPGSMHTEFDKDLLKITISKAA